MHSKPIKIKILKTCVQIFFGISLFSATLTFAQENSKIKNQNLTQDQYNQLIDQFTNEVNATKKVLDESENADASAQKQAFCTRLYAYQQIADISKNNLNLDTANMMLIIANQFLERQKQSFIASGMTQEVFCASVNIKLSENDIKMAKNDN
ncbi:hypothetical protein [Acinetobacter sp. Marseille-Q1618]|uniref:hypothetical protein n=1 Tax=Acinetobacter sp. Marseille-Q1618 TaxID=2697502 RepID=UPI00156F6B5D|nr:hypothetical protein [Acinetobacter sp. Marseille-Q1618]